MTDTMKRDLYLKKFYTGELHGPLTGDIYKDKPWSINYNDDSIIDIDINKTLYENFRNYAIKHTNEIILYTLDGKTLSYGELLDQIDKTACALEKLGITEGQRIGVFSNNSFAEPIFLFASSKIGIMNKAIDFSKDISDIKASVNETDLSMLIMDEMFLPMAPIINTKNLKIVVTNTDDEFIEEGKISFPSLLKIGNEKKSTTCEFEKDKSVLMITSSGSTGKPKPIVHTNYSINSAAVKIMHTDYNLSNNNVMMKIVPAHIGLGIITTLYTSIISGTKLIMISGSNPMESVENVVKSICLYKNFIKQNNISENAKLNMFAAPMYYKAIAANIDKIDDMSYIGTMLAAGAKMTEDEVLSLYELFSSKGCTSYICNGYGQNEMGGAVTLNTNSNNKPGSAGFPVIGTDLIIVDPETNEILPPNTVGRILERSDSKFSYYEGMEKETAESIITLQNGEEWFDTKDLGYITEEGYCYITGRLSRAMIRYNCKYSIEHVEEKFKSHPAIKDCAIVTFKKENDENDTPYAYISLKDKTQIITFEEIIDYLSTTDYALATLEIPEHSEIMDELPYMNNGKINLIALEEKAIEEYKNQKVLKKEAK